MRTYNPDRPTTLLTVLAMFALSLFLQHQFNIKLALLFIIGVGLGATLMHAAFGFTGGWRQMIRERRSAGVRAQILLVILTSALFFPILGQFFPNINAQAALAPFGVSVLVGAFIFGIGMQLGGGCGSGTLFTVGQGQLDMLITLAFFIIGSTIGTAHLHWWLALPSLGAISLIEAFGWVPALMVQTTCLVILYIGSQRLEHERYGRVESLGLRPNDVKFTDRLLFGPWPLWWAVLGLGVFNLLTLVIGGHPWSVTFAFGLWGAKIWLALGGDVLAWPYWSSGYPLRALNQSLLADHISIMDLGVILGAALAAALAGKFAPAGTLSRTRLFAAVCGGLLMGYGARLAFGCNIGGLLAGISSGSLHGWLWLLAGFCGTLVGVRLRILLRLDTPLVRKP
ncbi:MAG: YeeE/YedE family protein [Planctomycetota bacterium]